MTTVLEGFGARLRDLRLRALLTQEELAAKAGVAASTIVRLEKGQHPPEFRTIKKLADALGVEPQALLAEDADGRRQGK